MAGGSGFQKKPEQNKHLGSSMITTANKLDAQPETRCAGRHKNVDCARLSRYPALSTSWVRLRLEFVVDADRAVMVGNNGNSDMRCTLAITGARRLRPAVKEGRAPALLCERWLGQRTQDPRWYRYKARSPMRFSGLASIIRSRSTMLPGALPRSSVQVPEVMFLDRTKDE